MSGVVCKMKHESDSCLFIVLQKWGVGAVPPPHTKKWSPCSPPSPPLPLPMVGNNTPLRMIRNARSSLFPWSLTRVYNCGIEATSRVLRFCILARNNWITISRHISSNKREEKAKFQRSARVHVVLSRFDWLIWLSASLAQNTSIGSITIRKNSDTPCWSRCYPALVLWWM